MSWSVTHKISLQYTEVYSYLTKCEKAQSSDKQHMQTMTRGEKRIYKNIWVTEYTGSHVIIKRPSGQSFISLKWTKQYKCLIKRQHVEQVSATAGSTSPESYGFRKESAVNWFEMNAKARRASHL